MNDSPKEDPIQSEPINFLSFVGKSNENFLVSLVEHKNDIDIVRRIGWLYDQALKNVTLTPGDEVIYHLLTFTHYHFLFSSSTLMQCHFSEAFSSARAAVDAALIAVQIIHDRGSQEAYRERTKPFDKLLRYLKNRVDNNQPLPHARVPQLLKLHRMFSEFASHADVKSFVYRLREPPNDNPKLTAGYEYFQFSRDPDERQLHALQLFSTFTMILDVFADYLIVERKAVTEDWRTALNNLSIKMVDHMYKLSVKLGIEPGPQSTPDT